MLELAPPIRARDDGLTRCCRRLDSPFADVGVGAAVGTGQRHVGPAAADAPPGANGAQPARALPLGALASIESVLRPRALYREDGRPALRLVLDADEVGSDPLRFATLLEGLPLSADESVRLGGAPACGAASGVCPGMATPLGPAGNLELGYDCTSVGAREFTLVLYSAPAQSVGAVVYTLETGMPPSPGSVVCIGSAAANLHRLPGVFRTQSHGVLIQVNIDALPAGAEIEIGATWRFQALYRNPLGNVGASQGIRVTFCE